MEYVVRAALELDDLVLVSERFEADWAVLAFTEEEAGEWHVVHCIHDARIPMDYSLGVELVLRQAAVEGLVGHVEEDEDDIDRQGDYQDDTDEKEGDAQ